MDGRKDYRVEMDSVGAKDVPEKCILWGSIHARGREFPDYWSEYAPGNHQQSCIHKMAAITNCEIGLLEKRRRRQLYRHATRFWKAGSMRTLLLTPFRAGWHIP